MYLFNIWVPRLHVKMTLVDTAIEAGEFIVVYGAGILFQSLIEHIQR